MNLQLIHQTFLSKLQDNQSKLISDLYSNNPNTQFTIIPKNILYIWHNKHKIPTQFISSMHKIKISNPEFKYFLFDINDSQNFLFNHFPPIFLSTYNKLIPYAYKSDFFRYAFLFIYGGIYLDIKFEPINDFKLIYLTNQEYFTLDHFSTINDNYHPQICNGFLVVKPKNPILFQCLQNIILHVKQNFFGSSPLDPTGPSLLFQSFPTSFKNNLQNLLHLHAYLHVTTSTNDENKIIHHLSIILKPGIEILKTMGNHAKVQMLLKEQPHYTILWKNKKIYY